MQYLQILYEQKLKQYDVETLNTYFFDFEINPNTCFLTVDDNDLFHNKLLADTLRSNELLVNQCIKPLCKAFGKLPYQRIFYVS
jgi:hypothetical protein